MNLDDFRHRLLLLRGLSVTVKQIVGNSLQLWLGKEPRREDAIALWIDPPWRLEQDRSIISTSADMVWEPYGGESELEYRAREAEAWRASDVIARRSVISMCCAEPAHDLIVRLEGNLELRSFSLSRDESSWNFRFYSENLRIRGWLDRITRETIEAPH